MAVIRVEKTKNYTVMSNYHLKDDLTLKAKGLMSLMLSLPENWDYSVSGLAAISQESRNTINSVLKELEENGYLKRNQKRDAGKFVEVEYTLYEQPYTKNCDTKNCDTKNCDTKNCAQLNTKQLNTNKENTKKINKNSLGEYKKVKLSDDELNKLKNDYPDYWQELIKTLDEYKEMSGKTYKNDYLAIKKWVVDKVEKDKGLDIAKFVGNNTPNPVSSGKRKKVTFDNF